jgi:DNA modification methylase
MDNELIFPTKQHPLEKICCKDSIKHPAKADFYMIEWIILNQTKPGDIILDPLAGIGRTGMAAVIHNRNCVMVELEERFVEWIQENMKNTMEHPSINEKGWYKIIHGDARNLVQLLSEQPDVNTIVTSPPYAEGIGHSQGKRAGKDKIGKDRFYGYYEDGNKQNIGNLPVGDVDIVVTSPPYAETLNEKKNTKSNLRREERLKLAGHNPKDFMGGNARVCSIENGMRYSFNPDNIGNLKEGNIDVVITSPPYGQAQKGRGIAVKGHHNDPKLAQRCYSQNAFDTIITSPPYEDVYGASRHGDKIRNNSSQIHDEKKLATTYTTEQNQNNIGNLSKETYYGAMLEVYQQCYDVLKPGGKIIIIVKDYIRNFKRVPLGENTKKLLEKAGFQYQTSYWRKLNKLSFWILNYRKKYPHAEKVDHEEIIIAIKPEE